MLALHFHEPKTAGSRFPTPTGSVLCGPHLQRLPKVHCGKASEQITCFDIRTHIASEARRVPHPPVMASARRRHGHRHPPGAGFGDGITLPATQLLVAPTCRSGHCSWDAEQLGARNV